MITLSSPTQQIIDELIAEEPKAVYWLKKQYHGDKGFENLKIQLMEKALDEQKDVHSDVVDYISMKGNRWMAFVSANYYKDVNDVTTNIITFCYYETYGSVGAFMLGHPQYDDPRLPPFAIVFTSHFFLRFCARLGVEMRSRWMVKRFLQILPGIIFESTGVTDNYGRMKVDCRFPGSIGRGIIRKDGRLIEIRTFLTDPELSDKQRRYTKHLRETADRHNFDPQHIKIKRVMQSGDFASAVLNEVNQVVDMGADRKSTEMSLSWSIMMVNALVELGYAQSHDIEFWMRYGEVNKYLIADIGNHYSGVKPLNSQELVDRFKRTFKNVGIKKYDLPTFFSHIEKQIKDLSKQ